MSSISVIIPTFNRAATLSRAIDSVIAQTHTADEIIIVDDGSTDETQQLLANYPQLKVIRQQNLGVSAARNLGIAKASGEWIAFLDSDDAWLPTKLQTQLTALKENQDYRFCHTEEIWVRNGVRVNQMNKHAKSGGHIFERCLPMCVISPSSALMHHTLFDSIGHFDESLPACEDYDLWLRLCATEPVLYIEEPQITKYGGHEDQLSRKHWGMDRFRIQALIKIQQSGILDDHQQSRVAETIRSKAEILIKGGLKHGNHDLVANYRAMLAQQPAPSMEGNA
ncbi:glycosyltransferase family 2 protein [Solemya elarraichensis gill symbiont]|uniref:glycosyltransferase family 2 protein n=1 Tax=Solemya elarraichensis gill symbiont TaxID=1918949 RepID=UPI001FEAC2C3|nr:glycosyltransferase family A protein [Solemya elarraichensis gill symbiont]